MLFGKKFEIHGSVLFFSYQLVISQCSGVVCNPILMLFGKNFAVGLLIPSNQLVISQCPGVVLKFNHVIWIDFAVAVLIPSV